MNCCFIVNRWLLEFILFFFRIIEQLKAALLFPMVYNGEVDENLSVCCA